MLYNQNVELRHLRYFVTVAEELHFSRAAEKLRMAQPPLSQQIRQLERTLGVRLFERDHHTVTLTNAGQVFLKDARAILEQMERAIVRVQDAQQGLTGHLEIGFIRGTSAVDAIIPDILQTYRQRFPDVQVRLREMLPQDQVQALQERKIKVGFLARTQELPGTLAAESIQRIPFVAVFPEQHYLASQPAIALEDLANEPFIFCHRQASSFLYDRIIQLCGFSPHIIQEISDLRMLLGLVAANMGISVVPASAATLRNRGVVYRPLAGLADDIAIETIMVWRQQDSSPVVQQFLTSAREILLAQKDRWF